MLNAFRRQRTDHRRASRTRSPTSSAQRLSASEDGSPLASIHSKLAEGCAQRLSASEDGSHGEALYLRPPLDTCSTPFGVRGRITQGDRGTGRGVVVLNAFRRQRTDHRRTGDRPQQTVFSAQRLSASEDGSPDGPAHAREAIKCSTPFGVRGRITCVCA